MPAPINRGIPRSLLNRTPGRTTPGRPGVRRGDYGSTNQPNAATVNPGASPVNATSPNVSVHDHTNDPIPQPGAGQYQPGGQGTIPPPPTKYLDGSHGSDNSLKDPGHDITQLNPQWIAWWHKYDNIRKAQNQGSNIRQLDHSGDPNWTQDSNGQWVHHSQGGSMLMSDGSHVAVDQVVRNADGSVDMDSSKAMLQAAASRAAANSANAFTTADRQGTALRHQITDDQGNVVSQQQKDAWRNANADMLAQQAQGQGQDGWDGNPSNIVNPDGSVTQWMSPQAMEDANARGYYGQGDPRTDPSYGDPSNDPAYGGGGGYDSGDPDQNPDGYGDDPDAIEADGLSDYQPGIMEDAAFEAMNPMSMDGDTPYLMEAQIDSGVMQDDGMDYGDGGDRNSGESYSQDEMDEEAGDGPSIESVMGGLSENERNKLRRGGGW